MQSCRNVRIWDQTSTPTSHFRTRFGSNMRPNFGLYVRIGIGHGPNFGPISVRIGIGHVPALSSVLLSAAVFRHTFQFRNALPVPGMDSEAPNPQKNVPCPGAHSSTMLVRIPQCRYRRPTLGTPSIINPFSLPHFGCSMITNALYRQPG